MEREAEMRRYAQETAVSVEKSKAEIETMLNRYGVTAFMSGTNQTEAVIAFEMAMLYVTNPGASDDD